VPEGCLKLLAQLPGSDWSRRAAVLDWLTLLFGAKSAAPNFDEEGFVPAEVAESAEVATFDENAFSLVTDDFSIIPVTL